MNCDCPSRLSGIHHTFCPLHPENRAKRLAAENERLRALLQKHFHYMNCDCRDCNEIRAALAGGKGA